MLKIARESVNPGNQGTYKIQIELIDENVLKDTAEINIILICPINFFGLYEEERVWSQDPPKAFIS